MESLSLLASRLRVLASTALKNADLVEAIRTDKPRGYHVARSADGVPRPVEEIIQALDDRGVTSAVYNAGHALESAIQTVEAANVFLDAAIDRWEGHVDKPQTPR